MASNCCGRSCWRRRARTSRIRGPNRQNPSRCSFPSRRVTTASLETPLKSSHGHRESDIRSSCRRSAWRTAPDVAILVLELDVVAVAVAGDAGLGFFLFQVEVAAREAVRMRCLV